jgi:hypothetical protein
VGRSVNDILCAAFSRPGTDPLCFKVPLMHPKGMDASGANCSHPRNEDGTGPRTLQAGPNVRRSCRGRQRSERLNESGSRWEPLSLRRKPVP